jgi:SAM-dependent methyltransferase
MALQALKSQVAKEIQACTHIPAPQIDTTISPRESMKHAHAWVYFAHGTSALNIIRAGLQLVYRSPADIKTILDFPCGHGRVMRAFKAEFPHAELIAADLDEAGVAFCRDTFGATPVISNRDFGKIVLPRKADLIWVGSLFTHLPEADWRPFLKFFVDNLNDNGLLVFTYAGHFVRRLVAEGDHDFIEAPEAQKALKGFDDTGFGFMKYRDHHVDYGRTLCKPEWVNGVLRDFPVLRPVIHMERGWAGRQDVVVATKDAIFESTRR